MRLATKEPACLCVPLLNPFSVLTPNTFKLTVRQYVSRWPVHSPVISRGQRVLRVEKFEKLSFQS